MYYLFDWGDGTDSGWLGPNNSSETQTGVHAWNKQGEYHIRVKAKDEHGVPGKWSDPLPIRMSRTKLIHLKIVSDFLSFLLEKLVFKKIDSMNEEIQ